MPNKTLTDKDIDSLYRGFIRDYNHYIAGGLAADQIFSRMNLDLEIVLKDSNGNFSKLYAAEKQKVITVFFMAFYTSTPGINPESAYVYKDNFTISELRQGHPTSGKQAFATYPPPHYYAGEPGNINGSTTGGLYYALVCYCSLYVFDLISVTLAAVTSYYLLSQVVDSVDRFSYNEGWLKATLQLATIPVSFFASNILVATFLTGPLMDLAIAFSVGNPFTAVATMAGALSIIGTGLAYYLTTQSLQAVSSIFYSGLIDAYDPSRFSLSDSQILQIQRHNPDVDLTKVICYIAQVREQMSKSISTPLLRSKHDENMLFQLRQTIRQLCSGEVQEVELKTCSDVKKIDLRKEYLIRTPCIPAPISSVQPQHSFKTEPQRLGASMLYTASSPRDTLGQQFDRLQPVSSYPAINEARQAINPAWAIGALQQAQYQTQSSSPAVPRADVPAYPADTTWVPVEQTYARDDVYGLGRVPSAPPMYHTTASSIADPEVWQYATGTGPATPSVSPEYMSGLLSAHGFYSSHNTMPQQLAPEVSLHGNYLSR